MKPLSEEDVRHIVYTEFEDALIKKDLTFNSKINFNFGQGWLGHVSNVLCWWVFQKRILIIGPTQLTHFIWTMIIQTGLMGRNIFIHWMT